MINAESVNQIKQSSIAERIQVIEILLRSLKNDIQKKQVEKKPAVKPFKVRKFSLGEEVHVDRDELHPDGNMSQLIQLSKNFSYCEFFTN